MAKQLVCDSCGDTTPDDGVEHGWVGVLLHKVQVPASVVKDYDLCKTCSERVRRALIFTPENSGSKVGEHPPHE